MSAKVRPDVKLTDLILPPRPEGWVPKDTWPDKTRNAKKLGRIPFGYIIDPEDEYKLIPDLNLIFILEKALDYLDLNHSLRDVCNWLLIETKLDVTHAGLNFIWKKHRASKPSPRTTRLKAQAMGMSNYKELKIRLKRTRKIRDIKTSLTQRQKKLEKLEAEAKRKEELKSKANSKYTENIRFDFEPVEEIQKEKDVIFKPNDGPQATFLSATELEVLYGGSAGGGKTYAMLADPMRWFGNKEFQGLLIRRTNDELREIKWKSNELYQRGFNAKWSEKNNLWTFPSGAKMWFTYLDRDEDVLRFQGQSFTWIGIDELTQYSTPFALNYLRSRLRSTDPELSANLAMRFTTNPGGPGHHWVKKMFIDPAPAGKAFPATDLETGEPMLHPRTGKPLFYRRFIPASLYDNPYLMQDSNYESALLSLPEDQRRKLLDGDWSVSEGAAFPEFSVKKHVIEPFEIPDNWKRFRAADYGYSSASCVLWFAIDPATSKLYVYDELYVSKKTGEELADLVLQREYGDSVSYGVLDSSLWHQRGSPGPSIAEVMIQRGCRWRPSDRSSGSRISGKNRLHELLKTDEFGVPDIIFFNNCRKIIADLQVIPSDPRGTDDIDDRFAEDHAYDALRYGIMSRPKGNDPFSFINKEKKWQPVDPVFGY